LLSLVVAAKLIAIAVPEQGIIQAKKCNSFREKTLGLQIAKGVQKAINHSRASLTLKFLPARKNFPAPSLSFCCIFFSAVMIFFDTPKSYKKKRFSHVL